MHNETRLAFVTCRRLPGLSPGDRLAADLLEQEGMAVEAVVWDDERIRWNDFDAIVVRSCWDYFEKVEKFVRWIGQVEGSGVPLWNPPHILRWNMDKRYLQDLERRGVRVAPTAWLNHGEPADLGRLLDHRGWDDVVIKPAVSANGFRTWRTTRQLAPERQAELDSMARQGPVMVQPLLSPVIALGEWSLIFLVGRYSHAVLKRAREDDFRVQEDFGGQTMPAIAPRTLVRAARRVLAHAPGSWLYARVDGCVVNNRFVLLELEMLEPSLYLEHHPDAPRRFAAAVRRSLRRLRSRERLPPKIW